MHGKSVINQGCSSSGCSLLFGSVVEVGIGQVGLVGRSIHFNHSNHFLRIHGLLLLLASALSSTARLGATTGVATDAGIVANVASQSGHFQGGARRLGHGRVGGGAFFHTKVQEIFHDIACRS